MEQCQYGLWDRKNGKISICGNGATYVKGSKNYLCEGCVKYAKGNGINGIKPLIIKKKATRGKK